MSNLDEFDLDPVVNVEDDSFIEPHSIVTPTILITINPPTSTYTTNVNNKVEYAFENIKL